jgi:hypothetical protein
VVLEDNYKRTEDREGNEEKSFVPFVSFCSTLLPDTRALPNTISVVGNFVVHFLKTAVGSSIDLPGP